MSLLNLYNEQKDSLLRDLKDASTPRSVVQVIYEYLSKVTDLKGEYVSGLTRPQAQVALSILGIYQEHFRKLLITFEHIANLTSSHIAAKPSQGKRSLFLNFPNDTIAGVGAASLFAAFPFNPLIAIAISALAGLVAATLLVRDKASSPISASDSDPADLQRATPPPDYSAFLSDLEELFKTVDGVVEEFNRLEEAARPRPVIPKLEDHPRFLEFIQDLLGWYQRKKGDLPEAALKALQMRLEEQLPDLFSESNIQIHYHNSESGERDLAFFDYEKELGEPKLSAPLMTRPALTKQGDVLLRGRVIEPRSFVSDVSPPDDQ